MPFKKSLNKSLSAVSDGFYKLTDGFLSMIGKTRNTKYNAPITRQHAVKRNNSNGNSIQEGGRKKRSAASKRRKTKGGAKSKSKSSKSKKSKKLSKALKTLAGLSHYYDDGRHTRRSRRS